MSSGSIYSNSLKIANGRQGYERIYEYNGKYVLVTGIGTNEFIVSAYPIKRSEVKIMKKVKLELEYLHGAIWCCDENDISYFEHFEIIKKDDVCQKLDKQIEDMYFSYYEFDSHDMPCWFNYEKQFSDRFIMRDLLQRLANRLNKINDGTYIVEPTALDWYKKFCEEDSFKDLNRQ